MQFCLDIDWVIREHEEEKTLKLNAVSSYVKRVGRGKGELFEQQHMMMGMEWKSCERSEELGKNREKE